MIDPAGDPEAESQYRIDVENVAEMARLTRQGKLVIELLGLFPEQVDFRRGARVLDIGCGPGDWVREVAQKVSESNVVGIDISNLMVDYARSCAQRQRLLNATFLVMDGRQRLEFPDATFDMVHLSAAMSFLSPALWPGVLQECFRVLRPGGVVCSVEAEGLGVIITPALARYNMRMMQGFRQAGQCFAPEGPEFGITAMQRKLQTRAGFVDIKTRVTSLDYSAGMPAHIVWYENYRSLMKLAQPFLIEQGLGTEQELDILYEQALEEMRQEDFCAVVFIQEVWGKKPA